MKKTILSLLFAAAALAETCEIEATVTELWNKDVRYLDDELLSIRDIKIIRGCKSYWYIRNAKMTVILETETSNLRAGAKVKLNVRGTESGKLLVNIK